MQNEAKPNMATPEQGNGVSAPVAAANPTKQISKPAEVAQPTQNVKPVKSAQPVQASKPIQPMQSAQPAKVAQPARSVQAEKPAHAVQVQPVQSSNSTQTASVQPQVKQAVAAAPQTNVAVEKTCSWWNRSTPLQRELGLFVLLPTLLVFIYTALIWSPMYVSETKFAVRSGTEQSYGIDIASQLLKTSNTSTQDAEVVEAYIRSPDIFEALDTELKVVEHYTSSAV